MRGDCSLRGVPSNDLNLVGLTPIEYKEDSLVRFRDPKGSRGCVLGQEDTGH